MENKGYHIKSIRKGVFGEISKIKEEVFELEDAEDQDCKVMCLVELSDLVGSIEGYLERHFSNIAIEDLLSMSRITKRAFKNGYRK